MNDCSSSLNSSAEMGPTSVRYYQLRKNCCMEINITLCLRHLAERLKAGWVLDKDRGVDSQSCFDCKTEGQV
jgi:hypothetical protein